MGDIGNNPPMMATARKIMSYDPTPNSGQAGQTFSYYDGTTYQPIDNVIRRYGLIESYGEYLPTAKNPEGIGLLRGFTKLNRSIDIGVDSNSAYHIYYTHPLLSASAGIIIIDRGLIVRNQNFNLKILFISRGITLSDERLFIGFGPNNLIPETDTLATLFPDGVPCYIVGYRSTDTTYQLFYNDNSGAVNVIDTTVPVPTASVNYFIEFAGSAAGGMTVTISNFANTVLFTRTDTTEIPAGTANLYWHSVVQEVNPAVLKNMTFRGMWIKARGY
jgi:hypothetical protein